MGSVKMEIVGEGVKHFREYSTWQWELQNISTQKHANPYANVYTLALLDALQVPITVGHLLSGDESLKHTWGTCSGLCAQFKAVSKLIGARAERKVERDIFYTSQGGYDLHSGLVAGLEELWGQANDALTKFVHEMKKQGAWDEVIVFSSSEFARTMSPNGNAGTDHGHGGQHFIMGGSINGGRILNKFLDNFDRRSSKYYTRSRLIARFPWESMFVPIATWMGVPDSELNFVFPNLKPFQEVMDEFIIKPEELFKPGSLVPLAPH